MDLLKRTEMKDDMFMLFLVSVFPLKRVEALYRVSFFTCFNVKILHGTHFPKIYGSTAHPEPQCCTWVMKFHLRQGCLPVYEACLAWYKIVKLFLLTTQA